MTTIAPSYNGHREGAAELALRRHGFDGRRLQKLARKVANDYLRSHGATLSNDRLEDMVSFLVLQAIRAALRYSDENQTRYGQRGGEPFASYLADVIESRCTDWYRSKAEGNGDRRYGNDNRIDLVDMNGSDFVGWRLHEKAIGDWQSDSDDFTKLLSSRRYERWARAADLVGWSLPEFVCITMDRAAAQVERTAA